MQLQPIQNKIHEVRGQKVMLDFDLAELYEVETKRLNEAVKRKIERFPEGFMFRITQDEWSQMRSQFATASDQNKRNVGITPFTFTEHGVTMLASVQRSKKAIQTNIAIVEAFISLKEIALNYKELTEKLKQIEDKFDTQFNNVFDAINYLLKKDHITIQQEKRTKIGYK